MDLKSFIRTYRTPFWLAVVFSLLLAVFAVTPDPTTATSTDAERTSEPTPGPHECVVCPIDQTCGKSGRCVFVDHTPLPCVKTAKFDDKAGFCLPEGVAPAPAQAPAATDDGRVERDSRGGIGDRDGRSRQPRLPGFGNRNDESDD